MQHVKLKVKLVRKDRISQAKLDHNYFKNTTTKARFPTDITVT